MSSLLFPLSVLMLSFSFPDSHFFTPGEVQTPSCSSEEVELDAGFEQAVFSRSGLLGMLSHSEATGIRFYNVKASSSDPSGTVMAIAVREDGSEIDGGFSSKRYVRSDGYTGSGVRSTELSCEEAEAHCANVTASGLISFCSTFSRAEITSLTSNYRANTLRLTPGESEGHNTMMMESVSLIRGEMTDLGSGQGFDVMDGDPCPIACGVGQEENYINR